MPSEKEAAHILFREIQFAYRVASGELVLQENMTDADRDYVTARVQREADALDQEADALKKFGKHKFGANDNSSS
jgi:hypothetical protein